MRRSIMIAVLLLVATATAVQVTGPTSMVVYRGDSAGAWYQVRQDSIGFDHIEVVVNRTFGFSASTDTFAFEMIGGQRDSLRVSFFTPIMTPRGTAGSIRVLALALGTGDSSVVVTQLSLGLRTHQVEWVGSPNPQEIRISQNSDPVLVGAKLFNAGTTNQQVYVALQQMAGDTILRQSSKTVALVPEETLSVFLPVQPESLPVGRFTMRWIEWGIAEPPDTLLGRIYILDSAGGGWRKIGIQFPVSSISSRAPFKAWVEDTSLVLVVLGQRDGGQIFARLPGSSEVVSRPLPNLTNKALKSAQLDWLSEGSLLLTGDRFSFGVAVDSLGVPRSNFLKLLAPLPVAVSSGAAVATGQDYVFAVTPRSCSLWAYNIAQDQWRTLDTLPRLSAKKKFKAGTGTAMSTKNDETIYLIGGIKEKPFFSCSPAYQRWNKLPAYQGNKGKKGSCLNISTGWRFDGKHQFLPLDSADGPGVEFDATIKTAAMIGEPSRGTLTFVVIDSKGFVWTQRIIYANSTPSSSSPAQTQATGGTSVVNTACVVSLRAMPKELTDAATTGAVTGIDGRVVRQVATGGIYFYHDKVTSKVTKVVVTE